MTEENAYVTASRPREQATFVVNGSGVPPHDPLPEVVPLRRDLVDAMRALSRSWCAPVAFKCSNEEDRSGAWRSPAGSLMGAVF